MNTGETLRRHRIRAGLSQQQLAERAGVSLRGLRDIERGRVRVPRARSITALAAGLGLSAAERHALLAATRDQDGECLVRFGVLGPLTVWREGSAIPLGPAMRRHLLGLLALHSGVTVSRDEIVDVLWGDRPPRTCLSLLQVYIGQLRRLLDIDHPDCRPATIALSHHGYRLVVDRGQVDLTGFEDLVTRAGQARSAGDVDAAASEYESALRCWRGPVLADLGPRLRHHPTAVAAAEHRVTATLAYADLCLDTGRAEAAVSWLRALVHDEPLHEGLHARLVLALAESGELAGALKLYADIRARLAEELGVEPGAELRATHMRALRREVGAAAAIAGEPARPPAQLPADVLPFSGRSAQLRQLDRLAATGAALAVIAGAPGVGKTALAVHWAHRAHDLFSDGQLYADLRGHSAAAPAIAVQVLTRFLRALGVPEGHVPADLDEAGNLYRTMLAGRRVLVLLDNAQSADQVRPLLPGSRGCLTLVTSRCRLAGLVAREGARRVPVDVLSPAEAGDLLARIVGDEQVRAETAAAAEIVELCGRLPLALRIAAANLAVGRHRTIAGYAATLRSGDRLTALRVPEDERMTVSAAFDLSYRTLPPAARRLFRLLSLVPGADLRTGATFALHGGTPDETARLMDLLVDAHLVERPEPDRYALHGLLELYAAARSRAEDTDATRQSATDRLLGYLRSVDA